MPGAEEVALFDRIGALIRGEDDRFDLIVFDTAPTGHTLRLIRMPELMEAWIRALSRSRRAMLGVEQDDANDPIMMLAGRAARAPARVPRAAGQPAHHRVRAGADRRAAADRGDRARDGAARRGRRRRRRAGRQPRAARQPARIRSCDRAARRRNVIYLDEIDRRFAARAAAAGAAAAVGRARHRDACRPSAGALVPGERRAQETTIMIARPNPDEFASFYAGYIGKVPRQRPVADARGAARARSRRSRSLPDEKATHRYADGKWSVKEVLGHVADAERVFCYRLLRIARARHHAAGRLRREPVGRGRAASRPADRPSGGRAARGPRATLALVESLDDDGAGPPDAGQQQADDRARALCWILAGHCQHHLGILHERYGV